MHSKVLLKLLAIVHYLILHLISKTLDLHVYCLIKNLLHGLVVSCLQTFSQLEYSQWCCVYVAYVLYV